MCSFQTEESRQQADDQANKADKASNKSDDTRLKIMNILKSQTPYSYIWHKYRPVILRLMVNAHDGPQQYTFSEHEFRRIFPKNRSSLAFILYMHRSKAVNNIKTSLLAHALLGILKESKTAVSLTENSTFEFRLDENFVLHVRKNQVADENSVVTPSAVSLEIAVNRDSIPADTTGPNTMK